MKKGALVISLDFELIWGIFDHVEIANKIEYFNNTVYVVPKIVEIFQKNNINVTWATVGMLFNENWEEWFANIPQETPTYEKTFLNPYTYGKQHRKSGYDSFFFAPNLIKEIQSVKGQEIGTHTYSHYYCLEKGQNSIQFEADLKQALNLASKFKIDIRSLVFPRNQFNEEYLKVCLDHNVESVRSNPRDWYWDTTKPDTLLSKFARTGDAYLPFGKKSYPWSEIIKNQVICQPASRFLRPQHNLDLLNKARLQRIKNEIKNAASKGEVYHLWWHPHNFGIDPTNALKSLEEIVAVFLKCQELFGMESLSMEQVTQKFSGMQNDSLQ
jgi:peptidoglycan/xylan/chitin deacetylase (PgdA/CDA1 family)